MTCPSNHKYISAIVTHKDGKESRIEFLSPGEIEWYRTLYEQEIKSIEILDEDDYYGFYGG